MHHWVWVSDVSFENDLESYTSQASRNCPQGSIRNCTSVEAVLSARHSNSCLRILVSDRGQKCDAASLFGEHKRLKTLIVMHYYVLATLRWNDIDFTAETIRVDESVVATRGGSVVKTPKTQGSARTIAIDEQTLELIRELRTVDSAPEAFIFGFERRKEFAPYPEIRFPINSDKRPIRRVCRRFTCIRFDTFKRQSSIRYLRSVRSKPGWVGRHHIWRGTTRIRFPKKTSGLHDMWEMYCLSNFRR